MEKTNRMMQAAPLGIARYQIIFDEDDCPLDCRCVAVNPAFERLAGAKATKIIGRSLTEILPGLGQNGNDWRKIYDKVGLTGANETVEQHLLGQWYQVHIYSDQPGFLVTLLVDITADKKRESRWGENETRLRELVDILPQVVFETDRWGNLTFVNQHGFETFGYTMEDFTAGLNALQMIAPQDRERAADRMRQVMAGQRADIGSEYTAVRKDGTEFPVIINSAGYQRAGRPARLRGIIIDITDRKQAEMTIERRMEESRHLAEMGIALLNCRQAKEVFDSLEHLLEQIATDEIIIINQATPDQRALVTRRVIGLRGTLWTQVEKLAGFKVIGKVSPLVEAWHNYFFQSRLKKFPGSFSKLAANEIPEIVGKTVEKLLGFQDVYTIGIADRDTIYGNVHIITRRAEMELPAHLIETVVYQCFSTLARLEAMQALADSNDLLERTGRMAQVGGWEKNLLTNEDHWTAITKEIHEVPADYVPNMERGINFYKEGESRDKITEAVTATIEQGQPFDVELQIVTAKGNERWIRAMGQPEFRAGQCIRLYGTFQNIDERKRAEEALRESEERFKALHNASFGGIAIHDKGIILECNQGLSDMTGYPQSELIGMDGLLLIAEQSRDMVMKNILAGYEKPYEAVGVRKNGEEYPIRLEARNVPYKGKQVRTVEFRDITEQKQTEAERVELQAQLNQAQKIEAVGRLAGGVAHDFNNMLTVILGHAELTLNRLEPTDLLFDDLQKIQTAAQRSADITRQLLAFARKQTVSPQVIELNKGVEEILKMLRRLIGEQIDLVWRPGQKSGRVKMDPSQLDQILANLCVNARDAIADVGRITIETGGATFNKADCAGHADIEPGEYVMLVVSDDGSGMDRETVANIFEPFFTTKEVGQGTGLGLATVYGIVKQNKGLINVSSEPGRGTTFRIYLPRYVAEEERLQQKPNSTKLAAASQETILLVEDEPDILQMIAKMLEQLGYVVLSASTPGEALRLSEAHSSRIELLMTDVVMPEMNGRDLARNLLADYPNLKRLFMSGYTADVIAHHGVLDPGVCFIQKPFTVQYLAAKVREALGQGHNATGSPAEI